jgi:hypothetical protein
MIKINNPLDFLKPFPLTFKGRGRKKYCKDLENKKYYV